MYDMYDITFHFFLIEKKIFFFYKKYHLKYC